MRRASELTGGLSLDAVFMVAGSLAQEKYIASVGDEELEGKRGLKVKWNERNERMKERGYALRCGA